ncbi:hypothetical protein [Kineococcus sp. SYSU DK005]|uniref:hypothetical protein n=1 Tax=Kineococcus sp. SYSU DK005 TaxID=3383126 RepID=UPI003D7E32DC
MPLHFAEGTAVLTGTVVVDEAEPLAAWLRATDAPVVDLAGCDHLHTAALQALLAAGVKVSAPPADAFLRAWVLPMLVPAPAEEADENPAEPLDELPAEPLDELPAEPLAEPPAEPLAPEEVPA